VAADNKIILCLICGCLRNQYPVPMKLTRPIRIFSKIRGSGRPTATGEATSPLDPAMPTS
jgi:hypothetical protein